MSFLEQMNKKQQDAFNHKEFLNALVQLEKEGHKIEVKTPSVLYIDQHFMVFLDNKTYEDHKTGERSEFPVDYKDLVRAIKGDAV